MARVLALKGAELIGYPIAIGSEPLDPTFDSCAHWQLVMQGHAAADLVPVMAANRIGKEVGERCALTFYGSSFITDHLGAKLKEAPRDAPAVITATLDLAVVEHHRLNWGVFRDRRPALYRPLLSLDGRGPDGVY